MATDGDGSKTPGWVQRAVIGRRPERTLVRIVVLVAVCLFVFKFVLVPIRVRGISMSPTYRDGRVDFVNRLPFIFHEPQRGDIVAIRTVGGEQIMFLKRIIGLPGETLAFHNGRAIINGKQLDEPYVHGPCSWEHPPEPIGLDEYYVVGDNRTMEWGEHEQGRAKRQHIVGKILL